ncbi:unnamed protein product [Linum tenue]|nr:unnamed protein product [Linum tenue]
MMKGAL